MLSPDDTEVGGEQLSRAIAVAARRTAERRARFERAYMAALSGYCASGNAENEYTAVTFSRETALETVRQWDAMMAELDGEEG